MAMYSTMYIIITHKRAAWVMKRLLDGVGLVAFRTFPIYPSQDDDDKTNAVNIRLETFEIMKQCASIT